MKKNSDIIFIAYEGSPQILNWKIKLGEQNCRSWFASDIYSRALHNDDGSINQGEHHDKQFGKCRESK